MLPVVKGDWSMKIFKSHLIFLSFLLCFCVSTVFGFSTHNTTISRTFDKVEAVIGESITVEINSIMQTVAGRLVFARVAREHSPSNEE